MNNMNDTLIPSIGVITDVRIDTPDIKTFRVVTPDGKKAFDHRPGQCAMLSIPGVGEAMFSITSSPTNTEYMEFSIKKCGCVTDWLHQAEVGQQLTIRGPYGNPFPVDDVFAGKNLLFIAGGVGLAPLRSVINYCRHYRDRWGIRCGIPCPWNSIPAADSSLRPRSRFHPDRRGRRTRHIQSRRLRHKRPASRCTAVCKDHTLRARYRPRTLIV